MRPLLPLALVAALALSGCALLDKASPPVCDGAARRPANPHGSVLAPEALASPPPAVPTDLGSGGCA